MGEKNLKHKIMRHICICPRRKKYLKLTDWKPKMFHEFYRSSCFFFFFNKLLLLSSSKQNQAPRSHQVSAGIVHLTAFCRSLCWSGLNRGSSDNYKTMLISKADTVSSCTDMTYQSRDYRLSFRRNYFHQHSWFW